MSRLHVLVSCAIAAGMLLCLPDAAFAWGPATHVQAGVDLLRSLDLLPAHIAGVLAQYPVDFLYGNLAADISMAKKYAPVGRHCHHWHVAREMYEAAGDDERLQSALLGYQCHLAADVLAHNSFVPRMLLLTSSTRALGHSYWEHRMDADVGPEYSHLARWIVTSFDHSHTDALFRRILSSTLFTFSTNRRIFRGMIRINGNQSWQAIFDTVVDNSRWDLDPTTVVRFQRHTFELVADFLIHGDEARAVTFDPIGEKSLREAKRIRRRAMIAEGWPGSEAIVATADDHFPLPSGRTDLWDRRGGISADSVRMIERSVGKAGDPALESLASLLSSANQAGRSPA